MSRLTILDSALPEDGAMSGVNDRRSKSKHQGSNATIVTLTVHPASGETTFPNCRFPS